ncbi:MAG TPA: hypothetical protein VMF62_14495 [Acetobacteraceae bacterium]|jgi:phosphate:Na+ symporter|nr:hypothetical protein [Acetobacteraceae bacterium]
MSTTLTLLDLAGMVALLLWGVRMVKTGARLRQILRVALRDRFRPFLAGLGITAIPQSRTATGPIDLVPTLGVMAERNVGITLIVHMLSFDIV